MTLAYSDPTSQSGKGSRYRFTGRKIQSLFEPVDQSVDIAVERRKINIELSCLAGC
jgi:hypothetical protein